MATTTFQFFWNRPVVEREFRTGVSLHSHTIYSEESVESIPRHLSRIPYFGSRILRGNGLDASRLFWTPPLSPRQAYRLEEKQIHRKLQLPALVSLTDHDDIRAGSLLRVLDRFRDAPISTEWSVPFGPAVFHLGIHNLPPSHAADVMAQLSRFTTSGAADPQSRDRQLSGLLAMLNSYPNLLIVLNHPLWDESDLGSKRHAETLSQFLVRHGRTVHALELNGLRPWRENRRVIVLARDMNLPAISGGDRHGLEPNSTVNLSQQRNFEAFVNEIRYAKTSHVVFMPQYREPHRLRMIRMIAEVLADYPESPGRATWPERVFIRQSETGPPTPVASIWGGSRHCPKLLRQIVRAIQLTQHGSMRFALRLALGGHESLESG
ncbi:MAG: hypothetical protein JOY62_09980 [Acidobacteriaceae bacterium]|nr:hypothetical protein [Acidobacteriaceae bacterium]MBV9780286.1 hypothetical protein [Acidobacteriaceae bacterium]